MYGSQFSPARDDVLGRARLHLVGRGPSVRGLTVERLPPCEPPYDDEQPDGEPWQPPVRAQLRLVPLPAPPGQPDAPGSPTDGLVGTERTPRRQLPDPRQSALALARAVLEVIAGDRSVLQLRGWLQPAALEVVDENRRAGRTWAGSIRSVHVHEPADGVAEACVVLSRGRRVAAMALRLEGLDGRWQLTVVQLGF